MSLRLLLFAALLAGAVAHASPARAAASEEEADARAMEATNVIVPVVVDGRLVNYVFVTVRVELNPAGDVWGVKERSHFLRDALLRASHRTPMATATPQAQIDQRAAVAAFTAAAREALGERAVRHISVTQTSALRR